MPNPRLTLKARTFAFATLSACVPWTVSVHAAKSRVEWVSVYSGNEASFSSADRKRLLAALEGLGVKHIVNAGDQEIMVNAHNRSLIQDLLAKVMARQTVRP